MLGNLAFLGGVAFPQFQVPLFAASAGHALLKHHLEKKKKGSKDTADPSKEDASVHAPKVNSVPPVAVDWRDLRCTLTLKDGTKKVLLDGINGRAEPGRLTAIMGPSGSGKTTLLNSLAGMLGRSKGLSLTGSIEINGTGRDDSDHRQGYVAQDDAFYSAMTVRETLTMAAQLRLPRGTPVAEIDAYVDAIIDTLGLAKVRDSLVGDKKLRGLSGGERKRLSVACELIGSPSLIYLDEPTSGLDSFQAANVMATLKALAERGHTVVCVIHQPRSSVYEMFDDLILLSEGHLMYYGAAGEALEHFEGEGYKCPEHHNPADFFLDVISVDHSSRDKELDSKGRAFKLAAAMERRFQAKPLPGPGAAVQGRHGHRSQLDSPASGWLTQFRLLFRRSWRQVTRDKAANAARLSSSLSSAFIFGAIFFKLPRTQSGVQDRLGLLQVSAVSTAMTSLIKTIQVFPKERLIVNRERARGSYGVAPYFIAKLVAEMPTAALFPAAFAAVVYPLTGLQRTWRRFGTFVGIITLEAFTSAALGLAVGSISPSADAALALGPVIMLIWIVFGGVFTSENVPGPLKLLPKASLIKQAFEALCVNEFTGLELGAKGPGDLATGEQALQRYFKDASVKGSIRRQARILLVNYWITYKILKANKPKFQPLESPMEIEEASESAPDKKL